MNDFAYYTSPREKAYLYDEDGNVIGTAIAGKDPYTVDLDNIDDKALENAILLHNHPSFNVTSVWDRDTWTFSNSDIQTATDKNLQQIIAIGEKYNFIMTRPPGGWGDFDEILNAVIGNLKINKDFADMALLYRDAEKSFDLNEISKIIWKEYAKISGANYKEVLR
jgi:hypothetical protein